jgi:diguanylate cyclase (GGDEF)-like protein
MTTTGGGTAGRAPADGAEELLHRSARTRVLRVYCTDGSVIRKEALGPHALARIGHEAAVLHRLAGVSGVPRLLSAVTDPVLVLQDSHGTTLADAISAAGSKPAAGLDLTSLLDIAIGLAGLLVEVHQRGVIHKDINPANILLCGPDRSPMLIDFELATTFVDERPSFVHTSMITGTLAYLAPEQTGRTGQGIDHRADLYALGATLYELATGRTPFGRGDRDAFTLIHDHLARLAIPASELNGALPPALSEVIARLLEKEPDRRYQSAAGLAHDLRLLRERTVSRPAGDESPRPDEPFRLGERDFPLRLTAPSRLVGREPEIAALTAAFRQASIGRARTLLVTGPPGVGKTALIDELRPIVTTAGGWFVIGRFDQHGQDQRSNAVAQVVRGIGRLMLAEPEAALALHRERLLAALGTKAPLMAMFPEFALLLGVDPEAPSGDPLEAQSRLRQAALDLLRVTASATRPVVVVLDDLQWAPAFSLDLVDAVQAADDLFGLLVVGAYRDSQLDAGHPLTTLISRWQQLKATPQMLRLGDLRSGELGSMLSAVLRLDPEQGLGLAAAVSAHTNGNPYDTVELLNSLREEGALVLGQTGWTWDTVAIRRHIGQGESGTAPLAARISRLPQKTAAVLEGMACLGGEIDLELLSTASALTPAELIERLGPALEDGLLVLTTTGELDGETVRFRHERAQQATFSRMDPITRLDLRLAIARRLAAGSDPVAVGDHVVASDRAAVAAEQYLPVLDQVSDPVERRQIVDLFRRAATATRLSNPAVTERFLARATTLLTSLAILVDDPHEADQKLLLALDIERHAALYLLGQFTESDHLYQSIERRCPNTLDLVEAACMQIACLTNRARPQEAVALGLDLLTRLGVTVPATDRLRDEIDRGLDEHYLWVEQDDQAAELRRPEVRDSRVNAIAEIIKRLMPAAFFGDQDLMTWLVLQSRRLWAEHGPCRALVGPLAHAGVMTIALRQDYRTGYRVVQRILAASGERGYEPETSHARFLFSVSSCHWFEPLEDDLNEAQQAREGLLRGGDQQTAVFTYHASTPALLDCAETVESYLPTVEAGLLLATRTGNDQSAAIALPYRQLVRALRGETDSPGGFTDDAFDEQAHLAGLEANPMAAVTFHLTRALAAAVFADQATLIQQMDAAMPLLPYLRSHYATARAYLLRALSLASLARAAGPDESRALIEELDGCRDWLARRAVDAVGNFGHLLTLVDAERAWAVGDFRSAVAAFDAAVHEVGGRRRPWQTAFILERAATFHLSHGHEHAGRSLLTQSRDAYAAWGAVAKADQLVRLYPFLRAVPNRPAELEQGSLLGVSSEAIDLLAVLKASQALSSETRLDRLRTRVVEVLTAMTGATSVTVLLWSEDDGGWVLPGVNGPDGGGQAPLGVEAAGAAGLLPLSAFRYADRTRKPLLVADATVDDRFAGDPYLARAQCCSLLVVPILSQGTPRVMLVLENRLHRSVFSSDRLDAILLIAGQLAVSFDNALVQQIREREADRRSRLLATLRQRELLLETLLEIQRDISHRAPLQAVLDAVTMGASAMLDGDYVALVLVDPLTPGQQTIPSVCGARSGPEQNEVVLSIATEAIALDHLVTRPGQDGFSRGGLIAAPVHASGQIIGSLVTGAIAEPERQPEREDLLSAFAEQVSLALNDANTLEAIREASYDSLTGLASRPLFLDRLKKALESGGAGAEVSVLFIDLDRFKAVNDSLGHGAGDELLAAVAERLRGCIRESDTAARLGGDEFAVLLEDTRGATGGLRAADQIAKALQQPFRIAGKDIFVTASVGVAHGAAADHGASELLGQADLAMYRAKQDGSRRAVVFEPRMHAEVMERLELQGDLQRALSAGEFRLQFQPLLSLDRYRPVGVEALLRWMHPQRGMIPPDVFIPLAEETGTIVELGRWVLRESCRQVAQWRATEWPELGISVNVSGRQLLDGQLARDVATALADTGLPPRALTLELTETVLMDDPGNILVRLSELKRLGVQLAIDDFGTGYSSLSYLRRFPVDELKIDKSFIDNIGTLEEDLAIVRTVVDLAQILQLRTTAEGIETQQQLDLLRDLGCEVGQGYFFARPLDPDAVPAYLARHRLDPVEAAELAAKTGAKTGGAGPKQPVVSPALGR